MSTFLKRSALVASIALAVPAVAFAASFAATNTGPVPDNLPAGRVMNVAVSGIAASPTSIGVGFTATHSWVGDLVMTLAAPGGSPSFVIFDRTGKTAPASGFGTNSDLNGTYAFFDTHTGDWWAAAAANTAAGTFLPPGNYRSSAALTGAATSINPAFAALTPAQVNGTWTLTVTDGAAGDTGTVTSATLFINQTTPVSLQNFSVE